MLDLIYAHAGATPERLAIIEENRSLTYRELVHQVELTVAALVKAGIAPGERLLFWDTSKTAYLVALLACMQQGMTLVPLHPQAPPAWQERVASRLRVAAVAHSLAALQAGNTVRQADSARTEVSDNLAILMTSGTTGAPKAAPIHAAMASAAARNTAQVFGLTSDSCFLDYIPAFTVGGLFLAGLPVLVAGGTSLVQRFSPFAFADLIATRHPTHAILLPTMVAVLRQTSSWQQLNLSGFEAIGSGASTVPEVVGRELLERGAQRFLHLYGSTECLTPVMYHASTLHTGAPHTVFSSLCGDYEARLAADGELLVRGGAVMRAYLGDLNQNADAFDEGWFKTGDLFTCQDGVWRIVGRKKEILKVAGFSIPPAVVEKIILDVPGVRNCAVTRETLRSGGEALMALVEGPNVEPRAVLAHCTAHLPPTHTPRRVLVVDALPLNAMGKVDRVAVAALANDDGRTPGSS